MIKTACAAAILIVAFVSFALAQTAGSPSQQGTPMTTVSPDLARELGRRLGVPLELVPFDAAGKVFEAVKTGALDVMFLTIEPVRANEIAFTAPYVLIEGVYMVPKDSKIASVADVDRDGTRIGV